MDGRGAGGMWRGRRNVDEFGTRISGTTSGRKNDDFLGFAGPSRHVGSGRPESGSREVGTADKRSRTKSSKKKDRDVRSAVVRAVIKRRRQQMSPPLDHSQRFVCSFLLPFLSFAPLSALRSIPVLLRGRYARA